MAKKAKAEAVETTEPSALSDFLTVLGQGSATVKEVVRAAFAAQAETLAKGPSRKKGLQAKVEQQVLKLATKAIGGCIGISRGRPWLIDSEYRFPTIAFLANRNDGRNHCGMFRKLNGHDGGPFFPSPPPERE